jgi:hypothetical protein
MDDDLTMLIGRARNGTPLEIGVLDLNGEDPVVIHAMRLRPKFYPLIRQGRTACQMSASPTPCLRAGSPILTAAPFSSAHTVSTIVVCSLVPSCAPDTPAAARAFRQTHPAHWSVLFGRTRVSLRDCQTTLSLAIPSRPRAAPTMNVATMQVACRFGPVRARI